ncbi:MAG: hypothetical protein ACD_21C00190G0005 [uncultured bacterium]|nr:MAG: hypothetical protein ACD_21C00190G0005 [uncultured bacterium]
MATFGVFASGFIMRPVGALFLGHIGDKYGRKFTLCLNMIAVTVATTCIGLLPTYAQIGIFAPALLVFFRLLQGFFVGAEYSGVITYLAEMSENKNVCFFSSFSAFGTVGGLFLGSITSTTVTAIFSTNTLLSIGWRIPFLLSIFLGVVGYYIRKKLIESPSFTKIQQEDKIDKIPARTLFKKYKSNLLVVMALFSTTTISTYLSFIYIPAKLSSLHSAQTSSILMINSINILLFTLLIPFFGYLSDKIGVGKIIKSGAVVFILISYPLFFLFQHNSLLLVFFGQAMLAVLTASFVAPVPAITANLFPTCIRYSGSSIGLNFSASLLGGTAPMIATWITSYTNNPASPAFYLILSALFSLVVFVFIKPRQQK